MARSKAMAMPAEDDWQARDDVQTMMRADEICTDPKRYKRAVSRLQSTAKRYSKKNGSRNSGRSSRY